MTASWPVIRWPRRAHLNADLAYQGRLMRFLENHDEPRIAARLPQDAERAAAVAIASLPGATLWHEGQFEGRRVRVPVFLQRRPDEAPDLRLSAWYHSLLAVVEENGVRQGQWRLLDVTGWADNQTCRNLLAWSWSGGPRNDRFVVVVNLSGAAAQGRVHLGWPDLRSRQWQFADLIQEVSFERDGDELADPGLFVALGPGQFHFLKTVVTPDGWLVVRSAPTSSHASPVSSTGRPGLAGAGALNRSSPARGPRLQGRPGMSALDARP